MKSKFIIFLLIIILGIITRLYFINNIPGLSSDEASLGYNAYSVLTNGKDEFGVLLPLTFKAFGEYKAPLYIYSLIPLVKIFGLNEYSVRLASVLFGSITVIAIFYLVKKLFGTFSLALLSAFLLAILPWHIQFTRIAYEGSLELLLITFGVLFFLKSQKRKYLIILSLLFFILSFYSHYSVRVFMPLLVISLVFFFRKNVLGNIKWILAGLLVVLPLLIPILPMQISESGLNRAYHISLITDPGTIFSVDQERAEHLWSVFSNYRLSRLLHNKAVDYPKQFLINYVSCFDPLFLSVRGDEDNIFKTPLSGPLFFIYLPLLLLGFYILLQSQFSDGKRVLLSWLLLGPLPSALTRLLPSTNRSLMMVIPLTIIIAFGLEKISKLNNKHNWFKYLISVLIILEFGIFLDSFLIHFPLRNIRDRRISNISIINSVKNLQDKYEYIWLTDKLNSYIHFLFYFKINPLDVQSSKKVGFLDEYGFLNVTSVDKYIFARIPKYFDLSKNVLYISEEGEAPSFIKPINKIYYPDGQKGFIIYDSGSIRDCCSIYALTNKPANMNVYGEIIKLPQEAP